MESSELKYEIGLTYYELCSYLKHKYGEAIGDYFPSPTSKSKNQKISRTKEGLYCHHMDEDKGANLSSYPEASTQPYEWQKKDRLIYCTAIEHLILHVKIAVLRHRNKFKKPRDIFNFFTTGGIYRVCEGINDLFASKGGTLKWSQCCYSAIQSAYNDYIIILVSVLDYISHNYWGEKNNELFLRKGSYVEFSDEKAEILEISEDLKRVKLRMSDGEPTVFSTVFTYNQINYGDSINIVVHNMSNGYQAFYESVLSDITNNYSNDSAKEISSLWERDHKGFGFIQYSNILLGEEYGSDDADEYISKAIPMFNDPQFIPSGKPVFWRGDSFPRIKLGQFFIIRFRTEFDIKEGQNPSVQYRERGDLTRMFFPPFLSDDWNHLYKKPQLLSTSKVPISKDKLVDSPVILSLGREDLFLFEDRYNIEYREVLDGCYFI